MLFLSYKNSIKSKPIMLAEIATLSKLLVKFAWVTHNMCIFRTLFYQKDSLYALVYFLVSF